MSHGDQLATKANYYLDNLVGRYKVLPDFKHFSNASLAVTNSGVLSRGWDNSWVYVK